MGATITVQVNLFNKAKDRKTIHQVLSDKIFKDSRLCSAQPTDVKNLELAFAGIHICWFYPPKVLVVERVRAAYFPMPFTY